MVSAGLSLLESLNSTVRPASTTPKLDVLHSHPSMTTKGGGHSPPPRRKVFRGAKPSFELPLRDVETEVGGRAKFMAIVKGDPQPLVTWFADGIPIRSGGTYRYVKDGERHILLVPRVQRHSGCIVTCKATNQHGEVTSSAKLIALKQADVTSSEAADVTTELTEVVSRTDDVDGTITFTDDVTLDTSTAMDISDLTNTTFTSSIEGKRAALSTADFTFETSAAMDTSEVTDTTFTSSIEEKRAALSTMDFEESAITILNAGSSLRGNTGDITHNSELGGYFPPMDTFLPERDDLSPSKRSGKFVHFSEESLLQEYPIGWSDSSEMCSETSSTASFKHVIVSNDFDWTDEVRRLIREEIDSRERERRLETREITSEDTRTVAREDIAREEKASPPKFTKPICDCVVTAGETAHFVYILDSSPPTAITWHRNAIEVSRTNQTPNIGIIDDNDAGCLLISDAIPKHSGVYTCIAENIHGSTKCSAKLIVTPNLSRTSRSTSTLDGNVFPSKPEFKDQTSQTVIDAESKVEALREINDDETGEGGT